MQKQSIEKTSKQSTAKIFPLQLAALVLIWQYNAQNSRPENKKNTALSHRGINDVIFIFIIANKYPTTKNTRTQLSENTENPQQDIITDKEAAVNNPGSPTGNAEQIRAQQETAERERAQREREEQEYAAHRCCSALSWNWFLSIFPPNIVYTHHCKSLRYAAQ